MKTYSAKPKEVERKWWVIDARNQVVGRVATEAARLLRGKHKPIYTAHIDTGDYVVVINAGEARFTGTKEERKRYTRYTGYVGGFKVDTPKTLRERAPERILEKAVRGMIPHNRLGRAVFKKLKVYAGSEHPHEAQNPENFEIKVREQKADDE